MIPLLRLKKEGFSSLHAQWPWLAIWACPLSMHRQALEVHVVIMRPLHLRTALICQQSYIAVVENMGSKSHAAARWIIALFLFLDAAAFGIR